MVRGLQMPSEGLVDLPVYIKGVGLSGFGFSDLDGLSRLAEVLKQAQKYETREKPLVLP